MKRTIGYFTVAAAIVLIACSAQALFTSAYEAATELWQQRIQGTQIVAVIIWEAGAVLAIGYCWRHKQRLLAAGGTVLLLLAMAYTFSAELRLQAGTQENAVAKRTAEAGRIELVKKELDKAIARRDYLQTLRKPTDAQQDELLAVSRQIEKLKASWEPLVETTRSAGIPGAALIHRWTGIDLADAGDIDAIIKMFFWTMVRVFALPIALSGASLVSAAQQPVQPRKSDPILTVQKLETPASAKMSEADGPIVPPFLENQGKGGNNGRRLGELANLNSDFKTPLPEREPPHLVIDNSFMPSREVRRLDSPTHLAARWAADFAPVGTLKKAKGKHIKAHHEEWCRTAGPRGTAIRPLNPSRLGIALNNLKKDGLIDMETIRKASGVQYVFNGNSNDVKRRAAA